MERDYKNILPHIDMDRSLSNIEFIVFSGLHDEKAAEFRQDIEEGNDSIELHLIKSRSYKEALILNLRRVGEPFSKEWKELLKEEQKTFGGSKVFYINDDCSKLLVLTIPDGLENKLNMIITRLNKINEKISRVNAKIKKDNLDLYSSRIKDKELSNKKKDEIINFINQNLRV